MSVPEAFLAGYLVATIVTVLAMAYVQSIEFRTSVKAELRSLWDGVKGLWS